MATPRYDTKTVEHLGLVAGMIDELGIVNLIDDVVPQDVEQRQVTVGQAVKAMILNGLGFANRRLYLTAHFFRNKPTERRLGPGIQPEHLTDDALGKTLDALFAFGVTELFTLVAQQAVKRLGLSPKIAHLDATSFHTDGRATSDENVHEGVIHVSKGYRRDHRPDLNQVSLELIAETQAGIPMLMRPLSGNSSDKASFQEVITRHVDHLQGAGVAVLVDSSGYTSDTLHALAGTKVTWVMSVPATLSQAKTLLEDLDPGDFSPLVEGYDAARSRHALRRRTPTLARASFGSCSGARPQHGRAATPERKRGRTQAFRSFVPASVLV